MWLQVVHILQNSQNLNAKFFALQVLENVIKYKWNILPVEQRDGIKNYISDVIVQLSGNEVSFRQERLYVNKLNIILVQVLKREWPARWTTFIPDLIAAAATSPTICENCMAILKLLSEEIFDFSRGEMTQQKIKELKGSLNSEFRLIHELCLQVLPGSQKPELICATLATLHAFLSWIPIGFILESQLLETLLKFFPIAAYRNLTLQCLTEVAALHFGDFYNTQYVQMYTAFMLQLQGILPSGTISDGYGNGSNEEQAFIQNLALFLTTFFKNHICILESTHDNRAALLLGLDYLIEISFVDDTEMFKVCLYYWNLFVLELFETYNQVERLLGLQAQRIPGTDDGTLIAVQQRRQLYAGPLSKLRTLMICRMPKLEEVLIVEDGNGNIVRETLKDNDVLVQYKIMRETLIYLLHLDHEDTDQQMLKKLSKQLNPEGGGGMDRGKEKLPGDLHRGFKPEKCKALLKMAVARIKQLVEEKEVVVRQMRREVAQLLQAMATAINSVDRVIREENLIQAYNLIELCCDDIVADFSIINSQKACPMESKDQIDSILFASTMCADVSELVDVQKQFRSKYGEEFVADALEVRRDTDVALISTLVMEKLSAGAPDVQSKIKTLTSIAEEHNIKWDPNVVKEMYKDLEEAEKIIQQKDQIIESQNATIGQLVPREAWVERKVCDAKIVFCACTRKSKCTTVQCSCKASNVLCCDECTCKSICLNKEPPLQRLGEKDRATSSGRRYPLRARNLESIKRNNNENSSATSAAAADTQDGTSTEDLEEAKKTMAVAGKINVTPLEEKAIEEEPIVYANKLDAKNAFKSLLESVNVESDWTWDQAIRVIINDKRYGALETLRERKQAFSEYLNKRKKIEAEEKRFKQRKARDVKEMEELVKKISKQNCMMISELRRQSMVVMEKAIKQKDVAVDDSALALRELERQVKALQLENNEMKDRLQEAEVYRKKLLNENLDLRGNIRVFCRVRPMIVNNIISDGLAEHIEYAESIEAKGRGIIVNKKAFLFDKVFHHTTSQRTVFDEVSNLIQSALDGYRVCILSFGQTGSGKTYTMIGSEEEKGITPRSLEKIFDCESAENKSCKYSFEVSIFEIYNNEVKDLLSPRPSDLLSPRKLKPNGETGEIPGLVVTEIFSSQHALDLLATATNNRSVAETTMNEHSSRSHLFFNLKITGINEGQKVQGHLSLVDLAGSERVANNGNNHDRVTEGNKINLSLMHLGKVIQAIATKELHIPFRNCVLTQVLKDYLEGDSKMLVLANIAQEKSSIEETLSTLKFASDVNATNIKHLHMMATCAKADKSVAGKPPKTPHPSKRKVGFH